MKSEINHYCLFVNQLKHNFLPIVTLLESEATIEVPSVEHIPKPKVLLKACTVQTVCVHYITHLGKNQGPHNSDIVFHSR